MQPRRKAPNIAKPCICSVYKATFGHSLFYASIAFGREWKNSTQNAPKVTAKVKQKVLLFTPGQNKNSFRVYGLFIQVSNITKINIVIIEVLILPFLLLLLTLILTLILILLILLILLIITIISSRIMRSSQIKC